MRSTMSFYTSGRKIPDGDRIYWSLSAQLARRHHPPLKFFGTPESAEQLIRQWKIEFDEVDTTTIPQVTRQAHPMCWSAGKLAAMLSMAQEGKPFFHIDGDAFLLRALAPRFTAAPLFAQCNETDLVRRSLIYRRNTHYPINELLPELELPDWMRRYARMPKQRVINMGIFGGTATDLIGEYAEWALKTFVRNRRNTQVFARFDRAKPHFLGIACIAEQWCLGAFCHWKNVAPVAIMNRIDSFNLNRAHEVGGFVHLFTALRRLAPYRHWAKHKLRHLQIEEALTSLKAA